MPFFSFNGGIHLPPRKELARTTPHPALAVPHICHYTLLDTGASLAPAVEKGDFVSEGQIIARDKTDSVPPVHTAIPGRVIASDAIGGIRIEAQGSFPSLHSGDPDDSWKSQSADTVRRTVFLAGIALPRPSDGETTLIINTIDAEPNMRARKEILDAQSGELADGIDICAKALSSSRVLIAADKSSSKRAFSLLASLSDKTFVKNASVRIIPSRYPMSAAPLIIKRAYKIEVDPSRNGLPEGFAVIGAETVLAVNHAVRGNRPFCERIITITGKGLKRAGNYKIRFGTPISHIIDELGMDAGTIEGVILGGEMSGRFTSDYNTPVDKHIEALVFLSGDENRRSGKYPCIRCGRCVDVCPMRLLPNELAHSLSTEAKSASLRKHCISCGCCSAVCPSGIPLARMMSSTGESNG